MIADPQGLLMCGRYSFAPNSLHYCGPERQNDMLGYVQSGVVDVGLAGLLNRFDTLYNYLVLIAQQNNIADPFDRRVVEAYWLGNSLLGNVKVQAFAAHLSDTLKRKLTGKKFSCVMDTSIRGGIPQHNFHVLNIFVRTGHHAVPHTLSTMDQCRISWGKVVDIQKQCVVAVSPLTYKNNQLLLGKPEHRIVSCVAVKPKKGEWVSIHWGYVCDIVTDWQRINLQRYTHYALSKANQI